MTDARPSAADQTASQFFGARIPEYDDLMRMKEMLPKTRFGDCYNAEHIDNINRLSIANMQS